MGNRRRPTPPSRARVQLELAAILRARRDAAGLSQKQIGASLGGMRQSWLSRVESGEHPLSLDHFLGLCSALSVEPVETLQRAIAAASK